MVKLCITLLGLSVVLMLAGTIAAWGNASRPAFSRHEAVSAFGAFGVIVFSVQRQIAVRVARFEKEMSRTDHSRD